MGTREKISGNCLLAALVVLLFVCCKKETTTTVESTSDSVSQSTIAFDELTINNEFDQAADDAVTVLCDSTATIAGAVVDRSQVNIGIIEIDYYGKEADGTKTRTGSDSIHQPIVGGHVVPWGTPGATATITLGTYSSPGYEVLFATNNTSVRLSGSAILTNTYGGDLQSIIPGDSLVERIRASISFTYNDNAAIIQLFPWYLNQIRVFTLSGSITSATTRGDTSINGYLNVGTWGTDRLGNSFYTSTNTPVVQNISTANLSYNPLSGNKTIEGITEPITNTYGVTSLGGIQSTGTPYGLLATWIDNGAQSQIVLPYYY
ncbi:MAG TPA: hypothetical protein VK806_12705 [Bacteroidia bacterium]|jgi:hypothetical protein|nr:hypothetical protein [Bacteroidia bacterium]